MVDDNKNLGMLVSVFIALIVGVVLLQTVADNIVATGTTDTLTNETVTLSDTRTTTVNESITISGTEGNTAGTSIVTVTFFGNATNSTHLAAVAVNLQVNFTRDGVIDVATDHLSDGVYNISYTVAANATGIASQTDNTAMSFFGNNTINTLVTGLAVGEQVNMSTSGVITASTLNFTAGPYNVTYTNDGVLYVADNTSRVLLSLIPLFFVLGLLFIAIMWIRKGFPDIFG